MASQEDLRSLVELYLRAEAESDPEQKDRNYDLYQLMLRQARPTADDIDWIDREVARRKEGQRQGQTINGPFRGLPTSAIVHCFRGATPMHRLYPAMMKVRDWNADQRDVYKAYVMACFSEIAYLHLAENELVGRDRYKIFRPSLILDYLIQRGPRIDVAQLMLQVGDIRVEIIETRQFVYLIAFTNTIVVIAVRGTVSVRDWLLDLEAFKNRAPEGFHHRGFDDEAKRALPILVEHVGEQRPLYITGHSLGGAVASILCKLWPSRARIGPNTPYVLASPRFGTRAAARRQPRFPYVSAHDLVPHLPPKVLGYSDEGGVAELLPPGSGNLPGWRVLSRGLRHRFDFARWHSIERHRASLGAITGEMTGEAAYIAALSALPG